MLGGLLMLNLPGKDLQSLVSFMVITGIITTFMAYILYKLQIIQWFGSLQRSLLLVIVFTILMLLITIWIVSAYTYINQNYLTLTSTMLVFSGLAAISFSFFVSRGITDRLHHLSHAATQLADGHLDVRLDIEGNDEITSLMETFNIMAHNLEILDQQKQAMESNRRDFVAWVSHDLRTPLTSMRVMMEAMADGIITDAETIHRYHDNSLREIEHMSRLIDDLFELAQIDIGHVQIEKELTCIPDLISDTIGSMNPKATQKNLYLEGSVDKGIDSIEMAPDKIQRVLYNLLENAIAYTPEGQNVRVNASLQDQTILFEVNNTGVVIPPNILPNLFDSFFRGESSRARLNGDRGTGLGLAIAKGFVEAHQGKIWVESNLQQGTSFFFTLPI
ncbi:hypothetical protein MASR2M15_14620 [Anaerolineales bacterium]